MNISSFFICVFWFKKRFLFIFWELWFQNYHQKLPETKVETFLTVYPISESFKHWIQNNKVIISFFYWITITNTRKKWYNEKYISQYYYSETYQLCLNTYCFLAAMISSKWAFVLLWLLSLMNFYFFFFKVI